jgi:RNA polymerase sigma factor (sigma-70 family)
MEYNNEIPFEPLYELIKHEPNEVWEIFYLDILKAVKNLAYAKNWDWNDLLQETYLYFRDYCIQYDPYYNGGFIPFHRYIFARLFDGLVGKSKAYIQFSYIKYNREVPSEFNEVLNDMYGSSQKDIENFIDSELINNLTKDINKRSKEILLLYYNGCKQNEISKKYNISQSRVSVLINKTILTIRKNNKEKRD